MKMSLDATFADLNGTVGGAADGDVIELDKNYINYEYGMIEVNKNITINGNGAVIDGYSRGIMEINRNTVLNDITFQNAYARQSGALIGSCDKLVIKNCTFINNGGVYDSSVIGVNCSELHISDSKFIKNGVGSGSWLLDLQNCNLTVDNCEFVENGRSIHFKDSRVTIANSSFSNNRYDIFTRGAFSSENSNLAILDSYFLNNSAYINCIVSAFNTNVEIRNSEFSNNSEENGALFKGNSSALSILKSKFKHNDNILDWNCDELEICESLFEANNKSYFNPILNIVSNSTLINASKFSKNFGILFYCKTDLNICNANFTQNSVDYYDIMYIEGSAHVSDSQFLNNIISDDSNLFSLMHVLEGKLSVENSKFSKNKCDLISADEDVSSVSVDRCDFSKNYNVISSNSKTAKITNSNFNKNAGISCSLSENCKNYAIRNCNFTANTDCCVSCAGDYGTIFNCRFIANKNSGLGMGGAKSKMDRCLFENNSGGDSSVVVWSDSGSITNCVFRSNTARNADGALTCGIDVASSNKFISNSPVKLDIQSVIPSRVDYKSGKCMKFVIVEQNTRKGIKNVKITVYRSGVPDKFYHLKTNSKGVAKLDVSKWTFASCMGDYSIIIPKNYPLEDRAELEDWNSFHIHISPAKTIVKAPKVVKKKFFKVTVKYKTTGKAVKKLNLKIKVFTGKKYKVYKVKTDKKGVAKLKTNILSRGNHKVVVSSLNGWYKVKATSSIRI